jgi:hypothetical protein
MGNRSNEQIRSSKLEIRDKFEMRRTWKCSKPPLRFDLSYFSGIGDLFRISYGEKAQAIHILVGIMQADPPLSPATQVTGKAAEEAARQI